MQIQYTNNPILQFSKSSIQQYKKNYQTIQNFYKKHWQVIETSIKIFILEKVSINIVALKKSLQLLVLHGYGYRIKETLIKLWNQIFSIILVQVQKNEVNPLISLIEYYKTIEQKLSIIFTLLKSYLKMNTKQMIDCIDSFGNLVIHQRQTIQSSAFNILCQLILQSSNHIAYEKEMILLIQAFRNESYSQQNILSQQDCKDEVRIDLLILRKIGLFRHLEKQFDDSSKDFYVQLAEQIPKDEKFLNIVNEHLERQIDLNRIFEPKQSTVYYIEKELIRQYYDWILDNLLQNIINKKDMQSLKIFWQFTLRLKDQAIKKLSQKLKVIIISLKRYFTNSYNSKQDVFKIVQFRQNLFFLTQNCFEKNRKISNLIYHTFDELLYQEEKHYLHLALKNILFQDSIHYQNNQNKLLMEGQESSQVHQYFKLFRISPSKQNFIKQFQSRFSKWILSQGFQLKTLKMQQKMIVQMKRQVGSNLMKKLDRMFNDVWRNNQMHFHEKKMHNGTQMKCLFLSSDWPVQFSIVFNIPDEFYNILTQFQTQFKTQIENRQKEIKWLSQMGTVVLSINGIQSKFSEIEASIIMLLDKSIRPLRKQQIQASLDIKNMNQSIQNFSSQEYLSNILNNLVKHNILDFNIGPQTYDINDENETPYKFERFYDDKCVTDIKKVDVQKNNNILIEAAIVRILKKRKNMQRSDITRFIQESIKNFKPTFQQITKAFESLQTRQWIQINRSKGIISYKE